MVEDVQRQRHLQRGYEATAVQLWRARVTRREGEEEHGGKWRVPYYAAKLVSKVTSAGKQ